MPSWKKLRHRIEYSACRMLARWIPKLSRARCVRIANAVGEFAFILDRRGRAVALSNVECAFGRKFTRERREEIVRQSYRNFARTMLDLFWAPSLIRPENRHWLRTEGWDAIRERSMREKRGVVLVGIHYGNWEWGSIGLAFAGLPGLAVTERFKNGALEEVFTAARQSSGQTIIPQEKSMLRMLREVKRGGATAFLGDLTVPPEQASAVINTLDLEMCVSVLHGVLALRGGALIAPGVCISQPDGSATIRALPPIDPPPDATPAQIAQLCWDCFEPMIVENPGLWLWPYKHFRFRPKGAKTAYPFYAHEWEAFDDLRGNRETGLNRN